MDVSFKTKDQPHAMIVQHIKPQGEDETRPEREKYLENVRKQRALAARILLTHGYHVIDTTFNNKDKKRYTKGYNVINRDLMDLAELIKLMAGCEAVYFCNGYQESDDCIILYQLAEKYNVLIINESSVTE